MSKTIPNEVAEEIRAASKKLEVDLSNKSGKVQLKSMKILFDIKENENPFASPPAVSGIKGASDDIYGACSIEKFASASSLNYTHEDAYGWLAYLAKFYQRNFWFGDAGVQIWQYYEDYDNWQDTYGADAVMAFYHSGHGGMGSDGTFYFPLGANWNNQGTWAYSSKMRLGNEQVRYIFWSTCYSCRVSGTNNPMKTWSPANLGFRMLFGYETTSVDSPKYGSAFWTEWNKRKAFSTAWLDASWYHISHHQAPSVVACGSTADEAKNRLFNERLLYWGAVGHSWWWWRWYNAATSAQGVRTLNQKIPSEVLIAEMEPKPIDTQLVKDVISRFDLRIDLPSEIASGSMGVFYLKQDEEVASFEKDGTYEVQFSRPNLENKEPISLNKANDIAQSYIKQTGLDTDDIIFDRIVLSQEGGGEVETNKTEGPYTNETKIQFTQKINGIPVLLPGKGAITITVDNDGSVTGIRDSTLRVKQYSDRLKSPLYTPGEKAPAIPDINSDSFIAAASQELMKALLLKGKMPYQYKIVPGTYEVGYIIKDNEAILVAKAEIEVDCGNNLLKRYIIEAPIFQ